MVFTTLQYRRRGYTSAYGVVTALSTLTGKVLDVKIMSKECRECMVWRHREGTAEFWEWWDGHQHLCQANCFGSSGSMDASGMLSIYSALWKPTVFVTLNFLEMVIVSPINWLLSRLFMKKWRLPNWNVSATSRNASVHDSDHWRKGWVRFALKMASQLVVLGGSLRQILTSFKCIMVKPLETIVMISRQWRMQWWQSGTTHSLHDLCPPGEDSWCGYQWDIAKGTSDYQHNHPLPKAVANIILSIFEALIAEDLLARCLHGGTQNQNEAINSLIWQPATKETHSGLAVVVLAVFLAVSHFNDGAMSISSILQELGIYPGLHCIRASTKLDHNRLRHSCRKSSQEARKRRKLRKLRNLKKGYIHSVEARDGQ